MDATSAWWKKGLRWKKGAVHRAAMRLDSISAESYADVNWALDYKELSKERIILDRRYDGHRDLRTRSPSMGGRDQTGEPKGGGHFDLYEDKLRGYRETWPVTARRIENYMSKMNYFMELQSC